MPPALLMRSTTATTARCMSGPYEPPAPVRGDRVPMGIGSLPWAEARAGALSTSPAVVDAFRSSRRVMVVISGPPVVSATEIETSDLRVIAQGLTGPFGAHAAHGQ